MVMVDLNNPPEDDESSLFIMLFKDQKPISQVSCANSPMKIPAALHINDFTPAAFHPLENLPKIHFHAAGQNRFQIAEWTNFLTYIVKRDKVAVCHYGGYEFFITPPVGQDPANCDCVAVAYRIKKSRNEEVVDRTVSSENLIRESFSPRVDAGLKPQTPSSQIRQSQVVESDDSRRSKVRTEDAFVRSQNPQLLHRRLVNSGASCKNLKVITEDACKPLQTPQSLSTRSVNGGATCMDPMVVAVDANGQLLCRGPTNGSEIGGMTPRFVMTEVPCKPEQNSEPLHARPSKGGETCMDRRVIAEDLSMKRQDSLSSCTRLNKGGEPCMIQRDREKDCQLPKKEQSSDETLFPLPRAYTNIQQNICDATAQMKQAPFETPFSLHREDVNIKHHMHNISDQTELEVPQSISREVKQERSFTYRDRPRYGVQHPEYLNTLRHSHSGWVFGALAELIDNSRDAKASWLDISITLEYYPRARKKIPVLSVKDNGCGMTHLDVVRMISLGHARPAEDNTDHIGRFGVGFKTGSMQLGKDVVVLTQSDETRSIAFLSRSYNENKHEVDIPIITYKKYGGWMDFDLDVHSKDEAEEQLKAIKDYSPFNEYAIGNKFAQFGENGTGTQIYIYNLSLWGLDYTLNWDEKSQDERDSKKKRDIWIRSKRVRTRLGQISQQVPLDYSLHAYLEYIFLNPRMKIYVQGTMVRTRPLAKSLNKTKVINGVLMGKNVELTLGRSQEERERGNCGIFLYWHGRLIEAYKRVGGMVQSADVGRGVIGVIDVTGIMKDGNGEVMVLNTKQGFQDCEAYAILDQWLACKADEYWDEHFDTLDLKDNSKWYKPDHAWVQCNKCLKWRILDPDFNADNLPSEWFCFMPPFKRTCSVPEQKVEPGVITVSAKRSISSFTNAMESQSSEEEENVTPVDDSIVTTSTNRGQSESSSESEDEMTVEIPAARRPLKRLRRGPPPRTNQKGKGKRGK